MIFFDTSSQVAGLAETVAQKGYAIVPTNGTPLDQLCTSLAPYLLSKTNTQEIGLGKKEDFCPIQKAIDAINFLTPEECTEHTKIIDGFVTDLVEAVGRHYAYARGVVIPSVNEMVERVQLTFEKKVDPTSAFKIVQISPPEVLLDMSLVESVRPFAKLGGTIENRLFSLPPVNKEEMLSLLTTGNQVLDDKITTWYLNNISDVQRAYNDYFSNEELDIPGTRQSKESETLVIYLISRKLFDNPVSNSGRSLAQWQDDCTTYRNYAAKELSLMLDKYHLYDTNGTLVLDYVSEGKLNIIYVYAPVYKAWIDNGGENEILFGLAIDDKEKSYLLNIINSKKEQALRKWNSYVTFAKVENSNDNFNKFIETIKHAFYYSLNKRTQEETEVVKKIPNYQETVDRLLKEQLANINGTDINNVSTVCAKITCRCRYFYNESEKILFAINKAMELNPNIDVREAALLSQIEYVYDYIAEQMQLSI